MTSKAGLPDELKLFRHRAKGFARFEDTGCDGKVMSMKYLFWLEWARAVYYKNMGLLIEADTFAKKYLHMIVHSEIDYFSDMSFPDEYEVLTRTVYIKNSSIKIDQFVVDMDNNPVLKMSGIYVFLDHRKLEPKSIPGDLRDMISGFEGENMTLLS